MLFFCEQTAPAIIEFGHFSTFPAQFLHVGTDRREIVGSVGPVHVTFLPPIRLSFHGWKIAREAASEVIVLSRATPGKRSDLIVGSSTTFGRFRF